MNATNNNNRAGFGGKIIQQQVSIDVEDVSGDELSITSVKGEGCGSDLSDSEAKHNNSNSHSTTTTTTTTTLSQQQQHQRVGGGAGRSGKKLLSQVDPSLKRPNTPLDFRGSGGNPIYQQQQANKTSNRPIESAIKSVRFQQYSNENQIGIFLNNITFQPPKPLI